VIISQSPPNKHTLYKSYSFALDFSPAKAFYYQKRLAQEKNKGKCVENEISIKNLAVVFMLKSFSIFKGVFNNFCKLYIIK
jgi:hypothetical protein